MFFNTASLSVFFLAASSLVSSSPIRRRSYGIPAPITPRSSVPVTLGGVPIGFNQQGGNLDDFFGVGNFAGNFNQVTIIQQQQQLVCSASDLRVVRQQLAVIQEFAKQIILQQICEVEIQTVIIQQINTQFVDFGRNVRRNNGNNNAPTFDTVIAQKITQITQVISQGGSLAGLDLGFLGSDIGRNSVRVGGSNWDDNTSPQTVGNAYKISKEQQKKSQQPSSAASATATEAAESSTASSAEATQTSAAEAATTSAAEATTASSEAAVATSTSSAAEATSTAARK